MIVARGSDNLAVVFKLPYDVGGSAMGLTNAVRGSLRSRDRFE
jgi:hypothetical protein